MGNRPQPFSSITLRPIAPRDTPFLKELYASIRADEMAAASWPPEVKQHLLNAQFEAQQKSYLERFPSAQLDLVLMALEPVGRLYVDRQADEHYLVDIALLPACRGKGIGGHLLRRVMDEAAGSGRCVRLRVESTNPAARLYRRLGFETVADEGVYQLMEWRSKADD